MHDRLINLNSVLERKSVFLFGPRQTGKSTWLKTVYPKALYINLLLKRVYDDYANNPQALESDLELYKRKNNFNKTDTIIIIIDEVQKIPQLLDEVHNQIELNKKLRFILTGSSARKLKKSGANLLGGRASWKNMFPLVYPEIKETLNTISDLEQRLATGALPSIYDSSRPFDDLDDYIQLYLNEEIKAEAAVRNYDAFSRFLTTASLTNAKQVNFTSVASDAQVPPRTVHDYFQILEDTLVGFMLLPFQKTISRKAVSSAKFYFFDTGLANALLRRNRLNVGTPEFGDSFEHFVITEIRAFLSYTNSHSQMFYWRSTSKIEVDVIITSEKKIWAIEIKSKALITKKETKGLMAFAEDFPQAKKIVVTLSGRHHITENKIECIPIFEFLEDLWSGKLLI